MQPRVSLLSSGWEGQDGWSVLCIGQVLFFEFSSGPSSILHFITTESKSRSIKSNEKRDEANIQPSSLAWSIKDLLNAPQYKDNFFLAGSTREIPSRKLSPSSCPPARSRIQPMISRGDEWSIKIFNCSQNFTFARFARKI